MPARLAKTGIRNPAGLSPHRQSKSSSWVPNHLTVANYRHSFGCPGAAARIAFTRTNDWKCLANFISSYIPSVDWVVTDNRDSVSLRSLNLVSGVIGMSFMCLVGLCLLSNDLVVWGVAVCVRVGMRFCKIPVDGREFGVTMKLSRWPKSR